jgi:hypothetical protein
MRRASHEEFNLRASEKYQPEQFKEAALNLLDMMNDPESWVDLLKQLSSFLHSSYQSALNSTHSTERLLPTSSQPFTDGLESAAKTSRSSPGFTHTPLASLAPSYLVPFWSKYSHS